MSDGQTDGYLVSKGYSCYVFALLFLLYMFDYIDRLVVVSLFPFLKRDWGLTDTQCGLFVSAVSLGHPGFFLSRVPAYRPLEPKKMHRGHGGLMEPGHGRLRLRQEFSPVVPGPHSHRHRRGRLCPGRDGHDLRPVPGKKAFPDRGKSEYLHPFGQRPGDRPGRADSHALRLAPRLWYRCPARNADRPAFFLRERLSHGRTGQVGYARIKRGHLKE